MADIAHYADVIASCETRYSLAGSNCYWFARTLFHTLAVRHYSFPYIVSPKEAGLINCVWHHDGLAMNKFRWRAVDGEDWKRHDPSSTGVVFRFLRYEENVSSAVFWSRLGFILAFVLAIGIIIVTLVAWFALSHKRRGVFIAGVILTSIVVIAMMVLPVFFASWLREKLARAPMRRKREGILTSLGG